MKKLACISILLTLILIPYADATVAVNALFKDHMVLQRNIDIPIWGTAEPGETVTVKYAPQMGFEPTSQKLTTQADKDGKWMLKLQPLLTSRKGARLLITGDKTEGATIELKNVLIGEVWLGSGQSNMEGRSGNYMKKDPDLKKAFGDGPYPMLRLYNKGAWNIADTNSIKNFSALLFSFGHALHSELDVPIGLMYGAVGGTPSGRWLTEEMANASPSFVKMFKEKSGFDNFETMYADSKEKRKKHTEAVKKAKAEGKKPPRLKGCINVGDLYKQHIQPLAPYAIRGVLWDQGESKTQIPGVDQYTTMNALIKGWRKVWNQDDFPFLHIQKPSGGGCAWDTEDPVNSKADEWIPQPTETFQDNRYNEYNLDHIKMGTIKNAPLVTASDLAPGIHPPTKYSYGKRACRVALGTVYDKDIVTCGPVYKSHRVRFDKIEVTFDNIGQGLVFKHGDKLQGFEIAGKDLQWQWADARIDRLSVIVSNSKIKEPRHVRYAFYKKFNYANLFNKDGMPALMFTTSTR